MAALKPSGQSITAILKKDLWNQSIMEYRGGVHTYPLCTLISVLRVTVNPHYWALIILLVAHVVNHSQCQVQARKRVLQASCCFQYGQQDFSIDSLWFNNPRDTSEMLKHQKTENNQNDRLVLRGYMQKSLQQEKSRQDTTKFGSKVDGISLCF